jgi:hypothetical protein
MKEAIDRSINAMYRESRIAYVAPDLNVVGLAGILADL